MEYNDCCLPPDDVLKKMRVEYQQKNEKVNLLGVKKEEENKKLLRLKTMTQLEEYCDFLEQLQINISSSLLKQKISSILLKTRLQIAQFQKIYALSKEEVRSKKNYLFNKNSLKPLLYYEVNILKSLLSLQSLEKESNCVNCLNLIIQHRLNSLHSIISLLN